MALICCLSIFVIATCAGVVGIVAVQRRLWQPLARRDHLLSELDSAVLGGAEDGTVPAWNAVDGVTRRGAAERVAKVASAYSVEVAGEVASKLSSSQLYRLRQPRYLFAANFFNNEESLAAALPELLALLRLLGHDRTAVSVYENGSTDRTKLLLVGLERALQHVDVRKRIVMDDHGDDWRYLCDEADISCTVEDCAETQLRDCNATIRIPVMAALRNRALQPLFEPDAAPTSVLPPTMLPDGRRPSTLVVFLNDVYFRAEDLVRLILTNDMQYDAACGMDFLDLQLYDTWVVRDIKGAPFSPWYPFVRDAASQSAMRDGSPFPVYSCWNGVALLNGDALRAHDVHFRSWVEGEATTPHPIAQRVAPGYVFQQPNCTASECQLIHKDLWAAGATRVLMNPTVWVLLMGPFNKLVLSWAQSLLWKERSDADVLDARLEASAEADPDGPPLSVTCGLE